MSKPTPEPRPATAVPAADALVRAGPLVVVLSEDLALLQSMDEARFAGHFIGVASLERFVDQLVSGDVAVAVVDCSLVPEPTGEFMLSLRDQFPCLALIAAGDSTEQTCISGLIADGTICRFVHKPASGQRLGVFLEAGLRRHAALLNNQLTLSQTMPALVAGSPRPMPWTALFIAAALAVALFFYWQYYERSSVAGEPETAVVETQPAAATDTDGPVATPIVREPISPGEPVSPITKLLDQARQRMNDGALLEPAGNNARQYIDEAHGLAPDNPQVRAAAIRLGELIVAAARRAIAAGNIDEARRWLNAASNYHVNQTTLDWLREQVEWLQPPTAAAPATPAAAMSAPSTTNTAPPATTTAPPPSTTSSPATATTPPTTTTEPQNTTTAPPATTMAPPPATSEPQNTTSAPPTATIALPAATVKPSAPPADRAELESN